jgi:methylmalonyl-CoA/ethylmalonyl-CoA epimerase
VMRGIHHVGIVVERLKDAYAFYRDVLGLPLVREAEIAEQGVRAALLAAGESEIELLEPTGPDTPVGRFLAKRGEGLHHLCFETADVGASLADLHARGVRLLDTTPRPGLAGRIGFLHPSACSGVLVELATPPAPSPDERASPLRLKRLVIGAEDVRATAGTFQSLFGFAEVAMNGGPRVMLAAGRGSLLVVPAHEVGGTAGMVALSCVAEDFFALTAALRKANTPRLDGTGEVTVEPAGSHGVHLHISRYTFP